MPYKDPEARKAYFKAYREANKTRLKKQYEENKEELRKLRAIRSQTDAYKKTRRQYNEQDTEKIKEGAAVSRRKCKESRKAYDEKHKEEFAVYRLAYKEAARNGDPDPKVAAKLELQRYREDLARLESAQK